MDAGFWLAMASLVNKAYDSNRALKAAKDAGDKAVAEGRSPTLDDLKAASASVTGGGRAELVQAIEEGERGGGI